MNLIKRLQYLGGSSRIAALIRHADRDRIPKGSFGNEVPINEAGRLHAFQLGVNLRSYTLTRIYSSPIPRCLQTAQSIVEGYQKEVPILSSTLLGDPGIHIVDEQKAGESFLEHGFLELYRRVRAGESMPGVADMQIIREGLNDFMERETSEGLTLYITHDSLLAFYRYALNGSAYTQKNWVDYLDGIAFDLDTKPLKYNHA